MWIFVLFTTFSCSAARINALIPTIGVQSTDIYGGGTATSAALLSELADGYLFNTDDVSTCTQIPLLLISQRVNLKQNVVTYIYSAECKRVVINYSSLICETQITSNNIYLARIDSFV